MGVESGEEKKAVPPRSGNPPLFVPVGKRQHQHSRALPGTIQPRAVLTGTLQLHGLYMQVFYVHGHVAGISADIYLSCLPLLYCDSCSVLIKQHMTNASLLAAAGELLNLAAA